MTLLLAEATERLDVPYEWQAHDLHYVTDYPGPNGNFSHPQGLAVVFGPGDPESNGGQRICHREEVQVPFWVARGAHERLLEPYEAYDGVIHDERMLHVAKLATFETAVAGITPVKEMDHHGNRAPKGLDMSFENGFRASSLGQLVTWLEDELGRDIPYTRAEEVIARLDHRAALLLHRGFGDITPEEARFYFVHEIVRSNRHEPLPTAESIAQVNQKIDALTNFIQVTPEREVNGAKVVDLRNLVRLEPGYSEDSLVLKAAAAIPGKVVWAYSPDNSPQHRMTEIFTGLVTVDHIRAFERMVEQRGMKVACIDGDRGIAIAYPTEV